MWKSPGSLPLECTVFVSLSSCIACTNVCPTTDCFQTDLGASVSDSSECVEGEMAGDIPNGMLCYTGLTPGSTATYSCDKGYELNGSSVLVCQANGLWNGTGPTCMELGLFHSVTELSVRLPTHSRCWWTECWSSSWYSVWSTHFTPCSCSSYLLHMVMCDYSN